MERKLQWESGVFDALDQVYSKAAGNAGAEGLLSTMENGALAEARRNCHIVSVDGKALSPDEFDALPEAPKEMIIGHLAELGLEDLSFNITDPVITVRLSPAIQSVLNCTGFSIIDRLEKLDGTINTMHPKMTLVIQAPLGGKKGLVFIEMLIAMLYPWLTVREVSSGAVASVVNEAEPPQPKEDKPAAAPPATPETPPASPEPTAPVQPKPEPKPQVKPQPRPEPAQEMVGRLSDLCNGSSPRRQISERYEAVVRKLGAEFFADAEQILTDECGNTPELSYEAMSRFANLIMNLSMAEQPFEDNTACPEAGKLKYYARWSDGGTCYDGGCYSSNGTYHYYYVLDRISNDEYEEMKKQRVDTFDRYYGGIYHRLWSYTADLPGAEHTEVFIDRFVNLYLKNPMGILGCFKMNYKKR